MHDDLFDFPVFKIRQVLRLVMQIYLFQHLLEQFMFR